MIYVLLSSTFMDSTVVGAAFELSSSTALNSVSGWFDVNPVLLHTSSQEKRPAVNRFSDSLARYSESCFKKHYRMSRGTILKTFCCANS